MPTTTSNTLLTLEEFHSEFGHEHGYEYWFGEAVRKGLPTSLHGITQFILMVYFRASGYRCALEVELRVDPNWEPRPDVLISKTKIESPYPTEAGTLTVIEVLSEDDSLPLLFKKCRNYIRIGIKHIFILDPESKDAWVWSVETDNIERIFCLPDGIFPMSEIWAMLAEELAKP